MFKGFMSRIVISVSLCLAPCSCSSDGEETQVSEDSSIGESAEALRRGGALATDVVLVHGAWADGSCWSAVIARLQKRGYSVQAVQLGDQSATDDAALVRRTIEAIPRPVVVAGHSYGGFVMSEATGSATNVASLVFVAAFAPDEGETIGELTAEYPVTGAIQNLVVDDQGNSIIEPSAFVRYFAPDIPSKDARVLSAVQHPTALAILGAPAGVPGWKTVPTYFQVSLEDQVIDPKLQQRFAKRMRARTIELHSSHVSLISHAAEIADLIDRATHGR